MAVKKTKTGASKNKSGGKTRAAAKPRAKAKPVTAANKSKKPGAKLNSNVSALDDLIEDLNMVMENFMNTVKLYSNLTPKERNALSAREFAITALSKRHATSQGITRIFCLPTLTRLCSPTTSMNSIR